MATYRRKIGDFLKIKLSNDKWAYARTLDKASFAIYDLVTDEVTDISEIVNKKTLFIVAVYNDVVTSGRWEKIGNLPLENRFDILPLKFIQDAIDPDKFSIYDPNTGESRAAKREECEGLERAAVWEPQHVEERILDHYKGKPNVWVEVMKVK